eukprot:c9880_g1_i1.p1 GENE.c9880_g1_i1~~c9880_g1_i1.p1  ORF type:complete len:294 (+),score=128.60 c9880_g1_i1:79-960(+)
MEVKQLVQETKLSDVKTSPKSLVSLQLNQTILQAAQVLDSNNILSAPVLDENGKYKAVVDRLDICLYTLSSLNILDPLNPKSDKDVAVDTVAKLISSKGNNSYRTMPATSSFADVLQALVTSHRVCIVDESGFVSDLVTQSDVTKYFGKNLSQISTFANQPLSTLLVTTSLQLNHSVMTVKSDTKASDAFAKIAQMGVQAIGVVDAEGRLTSQLVASKLQMFSSAAEAESRLSAPVSQYTTSEAVVIETSEKFGDILTKIIQSRSHRAFLVDEERRPTAVFTLSDIMAVLCGV